MCIYPLHNIMQLLHHILFTCSQRSVSSRPTGKISVKPFCMDLTSRKEMSSLRTWLKLVSIGEGRGQIPPNVNSLFPSNNTIFSESNEHYSHSYGAWDASWCNEQLPVTQAALCEQHVTIWDMLHSFKQFSIFITDRMMFTKHLGAGNQHRSLPAENVEFFQLRNCLLP